jgi:hypothetical protein
MTTTLADMNERMANVEKNMTTNMARKETMVTMETHMKNIQTNMANMETRMANVERNMGIMGTKITNVERNVTDMKTDMEGKFEAVNNEVKGLKTTLIEGFDEMKDVLLKMEDKIEENRRKVRNTASGDKENIIVAGGGGTDSVEMFNWRQRTWSPLQSLPKKWEGATSFVYNNHVTIAGGFCSWCVDNMIRMNINPNPDLSMHWSDCPGKLPAKLAYHSSVLYNVT